MIGSVKLATPYVGTFCNRVFLLAIALLAPAAVGCAADDSGAKEAAAAAQAASSAARDASMAAQNASEAAQQASAAAQEAVAAVSSAAGDSSAAAAAAQKAATAAETASTVAEAASAAAKAASTAAAEASSAAEGAVSAVSAQGSNSSIAVSSSKAAELAAVEAADAAKTAAAAAQTAASAAKSSDTSAATANSEAALAAASEAASAAAQAATAAEDAATAAQAAAASAKLAVDASPMNGADPGSLVVYSGRSESLVAPVIRQFQEATGIDVQVKYGGSSAIAATLQEEGENSPADIFWAQDPGALGALSPMFKPLPSDITLAVPEWARASDGSWVGVTGRARVVIYNSDLAESELPTSVEELTDPKWKGRVGWAPTNASFRVMVTAMRYLWGEDKTREWLEGMLANDVQVYPKNTPIVDAAGRGEVDIGLVNHYYLHRFIAEHGDGFGARNLFLNDGGPSSLVMVAGSGILETSPNPENAELFIRFLLSQVAQQYFAASVYEYPLIEGVKTHRLIPPIDSLNGPEIDFALLDDLAGTEALLREVGAIP